MAQTRNSLMLQATQSYVEKIDSFAKDLEITFDQYQKTCVVNAIRTITPMLAAQGYAWQSLPVDNIITVLQQTAFLGLNPSATPHECYYIVRKVKDSNGKWSPTLEFGIEGAGNDVILRKFGQDVVDLKSYIVYKDDEFTEGYMDGWDMTLPKYKRTFKTNKPEKVVYLIKKTSGEIDVQYADTQDVMKSLLANVKQNLMGASGVDENKILRELAQLDLYDILEDEKWLDYKLTKKGYNNSTYTTPLINPSYASPISMYNMIERKLRNHATRKYPKNFNHNALSNLYEESFDEKYTPQGELITAEEQVQIANEEIEEQSSNEEFVPVEKVETDDRPKFDVEEGPEEVPSAEEVFDVGFETEQEEPETEEENQQSLFEASDPDWL